MENWSRLTLRRLAIGRNTHLVICLWPLDVFGVIRSGRHVGVPRHNAIWHVAHQFVLLRLAYSACHAIVKHGPVVDFIEVRERLVLRLQVWAMLPQPLEDFIVIATCLHRECHLVDIFPIVDPALLLPPLFGRHGDRQCVPYRL